METEDKSLFSRVVYYSSLFLFFSVAVNSDWSASAILWWGSLLFLFVGFLIYSGNRVRITPGIQTYWWLIFTVFSVLGLIVSLDRSFVIECLKKYIVLLVALLIVESSVETEDDILTVIRLYLAALTVMALYLLLFVDMSIFEEAIMHKTDTGHWNGNSIGILASTGIILSLFLEWNGVSVIRKIARIVSIGLFVYIMYLTSSRKALIMLVVGICINIILRQPKKIMINLFVVLFVIIGTYALIMNVPVLYNAIGWRMDNLFSAITGDGTTDSSMNLRILYIRSGMEFIKKSPFWGFGADNFRVLNYEYNGAATYSHNNFVETLVDFGIIGFVLYYWIFVRSAVDYFKRKTDDTVLILLFSVIMMYLVGHIGMVAIGDFSQSLFISLFFVLLTKKDEEEYEPEEEPV